MEFTKANAVEAQECVAEILKSLSRKKQGEFLGHFNTVFLFINAAKAAAPEK